MPLERLKRTTTKENLWLYILTILKKEPVYAYEIQKRIQDEFGFDIGAVTAYLVLYSLEHRGFVSTKWVVKEGRQRKYYYITKKGQKILSEGVTYLKSLVERLE
jgi:DNA-binding PadR family transcriptional regulator